MFGAALSASAQDPYYPNDGSAPVPTDICGAHSDEFGTYHYHIMPTCLAAATPSMGLTSVADCTKNADCTSDLLSFTTSKYSAAKGL
jgi:hypothetical protein